MALYDPRSAACAFGRTGGGMLLSKVDPGDGSDITGPGADDDNKDDDDHARSARHAGVYHAELERKND